MVKKRVSAEDLTDEDVLKEFVRRFQCDGAVLIYLDSNEENGFGRWRNSVGRNWVNKIFRAVKEHYYAEHNDESESGVIIRQSEKSIVLT